MSNDDRLNGLDQYTDETDEFGDEADIAENEAQVIVRLTREDDGVSGVIDTIEGVEFDPGDEDEFSGADVLRMAAEMVLVAAGYDEDEVQSFLDTATRSQSEDDEQ